MIGRLLFKVIMFTLIILFFLYYQSNIDDKNTLQNSNISHLIMQEQLIFNELNIETGQAIPYGYIVLHNLPHIEGTLVKLSQKDEHTVLAKVIVKEAYNVNVKPERVIYIIYTGQVTDDGAPKYDQRYIWLIQKQSDEDSNYFIQGGKYGIVQIK